MPRSTVAPGNAAVQAAVAVELSSVNQRLFNNAYFRSVDALLLLTSGTDQTWDNTAFVVFIDQFFTACP